MKIILKLLKREKRALCFFFVLLVIQVIGTIVIPIFTANSIKFGLLEKDNEYILWLGLCMILIMIITEIASIGVTYISTKITVVIGTEVRDILINHIYSLSKVEFQRLGVPSLLTRCVTDIENLQEAIYGVFQSVLPTIFICVLSIIALLFIDKKYALIILISIITFVVISYIFIKKIMPLFEMIQKQLDLINGKVRERLKGIKNIYLFNKTKEESIAIYKVFEKYASIKISSNKMIAIIVPITICIFNLAIIAIFSINILHIEDKDSIGNMLGSLEYIFLIIFYMIISLISIVTILHSAVSYNRIIEILKIKRTSGNLVIKEIKSIIFKNLYFYLPEAKSPALRKINLELMRGENIGLIGTTSANIPIFLSLIMKYNETNDKQLLVNDIPINNINETSMRKAVSYVSDKDMIFSGTIKDNLCLGINEREINVNNLESIIDIVELNEFIGSFKDGIMHELKAGGVNISSGQRQCICIARALLKNSNVIIFDNCFNSIDCKRLKKIISNIQKKYINSLCLFVTYRINILDTLTKIIVMDHGGIDQIGGHQELMKSNQIYQAFARVQQIEKEFYDDGLSI